MKLKPDRNQITWAITITITAFLIMLVYYVLFQGSILIDGVSEIVGGMKGIVYGVIIAYVMSPVMNFVEQKILERIWEFCGAKRDEKGELKQKNLIRNISIAITMAFLISLVWGLFSYVIPQLFQSITDIIRNIPAYYYNLQYRLNDFLDKSKPEVRHNITYLISQGYRRLNRFAQDKVIPNLDSIVTTVSKQALNIVGVFINLIVGFIVAIYTLHSKESFCGCAKKMAYAFFNENVANEIISGCRLVHHTFIGFLLGKIIDSLIIGLMSYIGNELMDIPYPVLIAVIVGVTNLIPFFGPYIGGIMGVLILILINPIKALIFLVFVIILQQFDGNILGPKILGSSTGLSAFWVIFSIMLFGSIWGFAGWILGVPIFAVIYTVIHQITNYSLEKKKLTTDDKTYIETAYIEDGKIFYLSDKNSVKYRSKPEQSSWSRLFSSKKKRDKKLEENTKAKAESNDEEIIKKQKTTADKSSTNQIDNNVVKVTDESIKAESRSEE